MGSGWQHKVGMAWSGKQLAVLDHLVMTMANSPAHTGKKRNSAQTFKVPPGGPGVLMSVPLPLPVSTLTRYPTGVAGPLSFPNDGNGGQPLDRG